MTSSGDLPMRGIRKNRCSRKLLLTVESTNLSEANMSSPRCDACTKTMGLPITSKRETIQSIAFLRPPGIARMYSGLEMIMPSLTETTSKNSRTGTGVFSPSASGEKTGRAWRLWRTETSTPNGARFFMACNNAVFVDALRALPEIAKIFTVFSLRPNVEVSGLRGFSRRSARLQGWASASQPKSFHA